MRTTMLNMAKLTAISDSTRPDLSQSTFLLKTLLHSHVTLKHSRTPSHSLSWSEAQSNKDEGMGTYVAIMAATKADFT